MKIGYQTLDWSAETYDEENNNNKSKNSLLNSILEKIMNIFYFRINWYFFRSSLYLSSLLIPNSTNSPLYFNIVSGLVRISIFLIYLVLISQFKDIKRLFQYHGAEHKTSFTIFESGKELSITNAQKFSTFYIQDAEQVLYLS